MKDKILTFFVVVTFFLGIGVFFFRGSSAVAFRGHVERCLCHNYQNNPHEVCSDSDSYKVGHYLHLATGFDRDGRCPVITPTPIPPTPTPVPPTPTPTPEDECKEDCEEPTPTPTPVSKPTEIPTEIPTAPQPCNGCGQVPSAPMCPNSEITVAPSNFHILRKGSEAIAKWVPTGGDQVNLYYKVVGQTDWQFAVRDEANDGYMVVNYLSPGLGYTFGLQQKLGCGGGKTIVAVVEDPPASSWRIFSVSQYLWW